MTVPDSGPHGGDGVRLAAAMGVDPSTILDLSASLNPLAPDVTSLVQRHLAGLSRYPDPEPARRALAEAFEVDVAELLLTNGGAEAIALACAQLVEQHGAGSVRPHDFSLYARHLATIVDGAPRVRSNPGNPTGHRVDPAGGIDDDGVRVGVWDEAFWSLAYGTWTSRAHTSGAMVVGSLTKLFACPGLRLGYVLADPETIEVLRSRQPQWSVSTLAADVLPDLLEVAELSAWATGIAARRVALQANLRALGYTVVEGVNWVLVELPGIAGSALRAALAAHRVLARDCASFALPQYARIAIPRDSDAARLLSALTLVREQAG